MQRFLWSLIAAWMLAGLLGCGSNPIDIALNDKTPLTIEEWKKLDALVKYELETFERLKEGTPGLKSDNVWDRFMRQVVVPERQKDIPTDYMM